MNASAPLRIGMPPYRRADGGFYDPQGYLDGIELIGGVRVRLDYALCGDALTRILDGLDGVLLSGGGDLDPAIYGQVRQAACGAPNAARDRMELELMKHCAARKIPLFGICRGCQLVNAALGGTLVQDIPTRFQTQHQMPKDAASPFWHTVRPVPGTLLAEILGVDALHVNSYHHQCVDRLAPALRACAVAEEGFPEAVEGRAEDWFLLAVQWHPEKSLWQDEASKALFRRFGRAAEAYRAARIEKETEV